MVNILPSRATCANLIKLYFAASDRLYQTILPRSFIEEFSGFYDGKSTHGSFLPRLLCVLCIASKLNLRMKASESNGRATIHIPTAWVLVREWLDEKARTDPLDIWTLQIRLLNFLAAKKSLVQKPIVWAELGYLVRAGMEMGLHRNPIQGTVTSAGDKECRRRLWFTLIELDLHASTQRNGLCAFTWETFSCAPPSNLDDHEIDPNAEDVPPSRPLEEITANHLQAYAASTLAVRLQVSELLASLGTFQSSLYHEVLRIGRELVKTEIDASRLFPHVPTTPESDYGEWHREVRICLHLRLPLLALYRPFALDCADCPYEIQHDYLALCMSVLTSLNVDYYPHYFAMPHTVLSLLHEAMADAVYGVCHFVMRARGPGWEHAGRSQLGLFGWEIGFILQTVDGALERWLKCVDLSDSDSVGDLVALSIVWGMVQVGTLDEKVLRVQRGLDRILAFYSQRVTLGPVSCFFLFSVSAFALGVIADMTVMLAGDVVYRPW